MEKKERNFIDFLKNFSGTQEYSNEDNLNVVEDKIENHLCYDNENCICMLLWE